MSGDEIQRALSQAKSATTINKKSSMQWWHI